MGLVAGHDFDINGVCINGCSCGIRWTDIRDVDETCLTKVGFAHRGALNEVELRQIREKREQERAAIERAMASVMG